MPRRRGLFIAVILAAMLAGACGARERPAYVSGGPSAGAPRPAATEARQWTPLPEAPLSPRHGARGHWVDHTFIVMGGRDTPACPPGADCVQPKRPALRDGARYWPANRRWTRTAEAPVGLGEASTASVGGVVYWWLPGHQDGDDATVLAYDVEENRWDTAPPPPAPARRSWLSLAAAGDVVVAYWPTHESAARAPDLIYDPATRSWHALPADPLAPSYDRSMVWTGRELVLLALDLVPNPNSDEPSLFRAATLDLATGSWRRLADSEVLGGSLTWFAVDGTVVNPMLGAADGGELNNWGRQVPFGGVLDPQANEWSPLPEPPSEAEGLPGRAAADERAIFNGLGWILDVPTSTWTHVPAPRDGPDEGHAVALGDGRLYAWGGVAWDSSGGTLSDAGWTFRAYQS